MEIVEEAGDDEAVICDNTATGGVMVHTAKLVCHCCCSSNGGGSISGGHFSFSALPS